MAKIQTEVDFRSHEHLLTSLGNPLVYRLLRTGTLCRNLPSQWLKALNHHSRASCPGPTRNCAQPVGFMSHRTLQLSPREHHALAWGPSSFHTKIFRVERTRLKTVEKLPIPCKFCTYQFIRYSSTCYGKVRTNPLMANIKNPDFSAFPVANAAWFVVVRPCYLNRDLLSGPKGN